GSVVGDCYGSAIGSASVIREHDLTHECHGNIDDGGAEWEKVSHERIDFGDVEAVRRLGCVEAIVTRIVSDDLVRPNWETGAQIREHARLPLRRDTAKEAAHLAVI